MRILPPSSVFQFLFSIYLYFFSARNENVFFNHFPGNGNPVFFSLLYFSPSQSSRSILFNAIIFLLSTVSPPQTRERQHQPLTSVFIPSSTPSSVATLFAAEAKCIIHSTPVGACGKNWKRKMNGSNSGDSLFPCLMVWCMQISPEIQCDGRMISEVNWSTGILTSTVVCKISNRSWNTCNCSWVKAGWEDAVDEIYSRDDYSLLVNTTIIWILLSNCMESAENYMDANNKHLHHPWSEKNGDETLLADSDMIWSGWMCEELMMGEIPENEKHFNFLVMASLA